MKTKSKALIITIALLCISLPSCNYSANKQFEAAKQCYEDRDCEEAIRQLSLIGKDSPHYEEAQELLEQSYREQVNSLMEEKRYDEAIELIDTLTPESCYYGISRFLLPKLQLSKIHYSLQTTETKWLTDSTFVSYDNNVRLLQYMVDTLVSDPKLLERKESYEKTLSIAYAFETIYYYDKERYEEALEMLNKVNPIYIDEEDVSLDMFRQAIIYKINSRNRRNDIQMIKTLTSNITDSDYFDSSHNTESIYDLLDELREFQEFWKVINQMDFKYNNDKEVMPLVTKLENEVVRVQKREFPVLRKQYTNILAKELWINDIDVYCNGGKNTTISIIGYQYSTRAHIAETQNSIGSYLKQFRFKKSIYYWCRGLESVHSYNIDSSDDGDPVYSVSNY